MLVMKSLKILALPLERCITGKPLPPIKIFVVGIIETLDHAVPPWLFDRDEYRGHPIVQTQPDHQAEGSRITVAASKSQGIVHLQKVRHPHGLPAPHEAVGGLLVFFAPL